MMSGQCGSTSIIATVLPFTFEITRLCPGIVLFFTGGNNKTLGKIFGDQDVGSSYIISCSETI